MRTKGFLGVAVATLAAVTAPAGAQLSCEAQPGATCSVSHLVDATAPEVAKLIQGSQSTTMPPLTADDFDNPAGVDAPPFNLEVEANVAWAVSVESATPTWDGSSKLSTDLRIDIGGALQGLTTTAQPFEAGAAGATPFVAQLNSLWNYATDPPANYRITVIFTLSTP